MFSKLKFTVFISFAFLLGNTVLSQETVSIGTEDLNANAVLQLVSPKGNQGFLVPKLSTTERQNMQLQAANDNGMLVYDIDEARFYYWHNKEWYILSVSGDIIAESDPIFASSVANSITQSDTNRWNNSIASFTELDPVYSVWDKSYYDLTNRPNITDSILAVIDTTSQFVQVEVDGSITNEIQSISRTGLTVTLSSGGAFTDSINTQNLEEVLIINNDAGALQIKNIATPTEAQDAATMAYVDKLKPLIKTLEAAPTPAVTVVDYDGNIYNTVKIGRQLWMKENLKVTHYPNGDEIPLILVDTVWASLDSNNTDDAYTYYTGYDYLGLYGALYSYAAAIGDNWARDNVENQGVCPDGWHLPSDIEWTELEVYLIANAYNWDGTTTGNKIAKSLASTRRLWPNITSGRGYVGYFRSLNNTSGFSGLPGGFCNVNGLVTGSYSSGSWWSSTEQLGRASRFGLLFYSGSSSLFFNSPKSHGYNVRCISNSK